MAEGSESLLHAGIIWGALKTFGFQLLAPRTLIWGVWVEVEPAGLHWDLNLETSVLPWPLVKQTWAQGGEAN